HSQIRARATVGGSIAHADPAAELPALLVALDGSVTLAASSGPGREVKAADFFIGPLMTSREAHEVLTQVTFPIHPGDVVIDEVATRPGDFAIVGAVAALALEANTIKMPRIALFGVGGTPQRAAASEALLEGAAPTPDTISGAAAEVLGEIEPRGDLHGSSQYRSHLAATLVERSLRRLL
ncbi:MAG: FAD binding domain-containing protein, partial [Acidimicrobiales bacterium]